MAVAAGDPPNSYTTGMLEAAFTTDASFELACRATTTTAFSFGDDAQFLPRYAVAQQDTFQVCGSKLPDGWGLFDMHGNVAEWCEDWAPGFRNDMQSEIDPLGPGRHALLWKVKNGNALGFRVVRSIH